MSANTRGANAPTEADPASGTAFTVIGEAVIDLVPEPDGRFAARPGGSPLNVAVGLARLGRPVRLLARLSATPFGQRLREHAAANGVDLSDSVRAAEPATLAVVSLTASGNAAYDLYVEGTADWQWQPAELVPALDRRHGILHAGSLASFLHPGAEHVGATLRAARSQGLTVSLDPNIRPGLMGTPEQVRARFEQLVACAHVVKASEEDVAWLYPDQPVEDVLRGWHDLGAVLAVATLGPRGAVATSGTGLFRQPAPAIHVADTIGAGDAFTAGLLAALSRSGPAAPWTDDEIAAAVRLAVQAAAITCTRPGADPPHQHELPELGPA